MGTYINIVLYILIGITIIAISNLFFPKVWGKIKSLRSVLYLSGMQTDVNTNKFDESLSIDSGNLPIINVIFSTMSKDEEDISRELADMFVNQRTYFYTAQSPGKITSEHSLQENDVFVKYDNVNWHALKSIEV